MSVEAITWAMKRQGLRSSEKFVLVCMANYANEDRECYPSNAALADATSQDHKTVRANLQRLIDAGEIADTGRRVGSTSQIPVYRLNLHKAPEIGRVVEEGAKDSQNSHERLPDFPGKTPNSGRRIHQDTKGTQHQGESDPANPSTPKTPRSSKGRGVSIEPLPPPPAWVPAEPWDGFVEFRKRKKAPLTARAAALTFAELDKLRALGNEPGAVLDQSVQRGWTGVFPIKGERAAPSEDSIFSRTTL